MRKVFITAAGGDVGESVLRCLKEEFPDDSFWGCDIKSEIPFESLLDQYMVVPRSDTSQYKEQIMEICLHNEISHFCPTTEAEIVLWNRCRDFFEQNQIALMLNKRSIIEIASSKYKTSEFLNLHHIPSPETYFLEEYQGQLDFPLIVKPDFGRGSHGVYVIRSQRELDIVRERAPERLVVQRYIGLPENEYTVGVFSDGEQIRSAAFRRTLGFDGMSVRIETVVDDALDDIVKRTAKLLKLKGSINIQLRKEHGKYYIFEINPRLSSTVRFRHKLGFKDAAWWLEMLDGEPVTADFKIKEGVIGLRYIDEIILEQNNGTTSANV